MKFIKSSILNNLKLIFTLLIFYQIQRILFFAANHSYFKVQSSTDIIKAFLWGIRFDIWVILILNIPLILFLFIPIKKNFKKIYLWYFTIVNGFAMLFNYIDIVYFDFILKRSTADVFNLIGTGNDFLILLPRFIIDFWYIPLLFIFTLILLYKIFNRIIKIPQPDFEKKFSTITFYILTLLISLLSIFACIRGTRLRPVNIMSAALYSNSHNIPLVLNSPFSIIKTIGKKQQPMHHYFDNPSQFFNPIYTIPDTRFDNRFKNKNIIILILESFSKEHIGFYTPTNKSFTPFLDSLLKQSLNIRYSFANGRKSIESLPSILSGLPALTTTPYILSPYAANDLEALPTILGKYGYYTSFYHGGTNGTMGFDVFSSAAGIQHYFGRWQYPDQKDYDGSWGIWDEPYLTYVKEMFDHQPQPFFSVIYTLSSHHPYNVPHKYKNILPLGEHPILQSIAYTDLALRKFFELAKNTKWFNHSIFIITADHVFAEHSEFYYNYVGYYSVPIAIYIPGDSSFKGTLNIIAQHVDIFPSILHLLSIKDTIFTFGRSFWDTIQTKRYAISYLNEQYLFFCHDYLINFDGEKTTAAYHFKTDSLLKSNIMKNSIPNFTYYENFLKAIIQTYDYSIINNKLTHKRFNERY